MGPITHPSPKREAAIFSDPDRRLEFETMYARGPKGSANSLK